MTRDQQQALDKAQAQYRSLRDEFDDLLAKCGDDAARKRQLGDALNEALDNYIEVENHIMVEDQATVADLNGTLTAAQQAINNATKNIANIADSLNAITAAVKGVAILVAALG